MGTTTSVVVFNRKIRELQKVPNKIAVAAVKINATNATSNAKQAVKVATSGKARLRNAGALVRAGESGRVVGRKGAALTVTSKVTADGTLATVKAEGPWQLVEYPTKQHFIGPAGVKKTAVGSKSGRASTRARRGRATALRTPYGVKRWVYVKGTKGKFPWRKASEKTAVQASKAMKQAAQAEFARLK